MSLRGRLRALGTMFLRGIEFEVWQNLLQDNDFAIDSRFISRAATTTAFSLVNSTIRADDDQLLSKVCRTVIEPPVFVLGHPRSGTTFLHNLLAIDPQFAFPNVYQVNFPNSFLTTEPLLSRPLGWIFPRGARQLDDLEEDITSPAEDEWATCNMSGISPHLSFVFPRRADYYDRYATFREATPKEIAAWQAALVLFLQKLTWKYRRPLVMKSPAHTGRIRYLLELFPTARFVHIHRHPFAVFRSMRRATGMMLRRAQLQQVADAEIDERVINRYRDMFAEFHEQKRLIPAGQYHELSYEDLRRNPVEQLRIIYEQLRLPDFEAAAPRLHDYAQSLCGYENNQTAELAGQTKTLLVTAWARSFEEWSYNSATCAG